MQGPVWLPAVDRLFFVSNRLGDLSTPNQHVEMWTLNPSTLALAQLQPSVPILTANGATNWSPTEVLVTQQVISTALQQDLNCPCQQKSALSACMFHTSGALERSSGGRK